MEQFTIKCAVNSPLLGVIESWLGCLLKRHALVQPLIFGLDVGTAGGNLQSSYAGIQTRW